jgi:hypothetical protein
MKELNEYINEALSTSQAKQCQMIMKMFENCGLTKDNFATMLSKLDMKELQSLATYISSVDNANFVAYQPKDDEFLKDSNKEQVIDKISQYLFKYIANA